MKYSAAIYFVTIAIWLSFLFIAWNKIFLKEIRFSIIIVVNCKLVKVCLNCFHLVSGDHIHNYFIIQSELTINIIITYYKYITLSIVFQFIPSKVSRQNASPSTEAHICRLNLVL